MDRMDVYDAWVGLDNPWEIWVKPAVFASLDVVAAPEPGTAPPWSTIDVRWAPPAGQGTFFLVDLDGAASIELGLALMSRGYRPIVSINTIAEPGTAVDMEGVSEALRLGARHPQAFPDEAAPPAFLLDARRMSPTDHPGHPGRDALDNRWMIFQQDLPSAAFLRRRGLTRVVVVQHDRPLAEDLRHVLHAWQEGGIEICARDADGELPIEAMPVEAPSWLRRLLGPAGAGHLPQRRAATPLPPTPSHG